MYKYLIVFFIISSLGFSEENQKKLKFKLERDKVDKIEIIITSEDEVKKYKIVKNDTLSELSKKLKITIKEFQELNNIENINLIYEANNLCYIKVKENEAK
ncbi:MAG: LysM peptidoglycan-binding domain-containing protein [Fusobacteriaceae bacterium]